MRTADPLVYDAHAHGLAGDGTTNDQPALAALVDTLGAAYAADGQQRTILCPAGTYSIQDEGVRWRTGVSLIGSGPAATRFVLSNPRQPTSPTPLACFTTREHDAGRDNHIADCTFAHFEIDGSGVTLPEYDVNAKGLFLQYVLRGRFHDLYIHDTGATGFGCDFLQDTVVDDVLAVHCGRLNNGEEMAAPASASASAAGATPNGSRSPRARRSATAPTASSSSSRNAAGPRRAASASSAATRRATASASPTGAPMGSSSRRAR
jgi:hypothetical protein